MFEPASWPMSCSVRMIPRCERNGTSATRTESPERPTTSTTPPSAGRRGAPITTTPNAANTGRTASNRGALSWLPEMTMTWAPVSRRSSSVLSTSASASGVGAAVS